MHIEFAQPLYLLLVPPLAYYTWRLTKNSLADMSGFRAKFSLGLRMLIILLLLFALAGVMAVKSIDSKSVVFVMDLSESISKAEQEAALKYVNTTIEGMQPDDLVGMVVFGSDALVELSPQAAVKVDKIHSVPKTNQTNISQAMSLGMALFPEKTSKKMVLISDGVQTRGNVLEQASMAASAGVSIDVVPVLTRKTKEVLLDKMLVPETVKTGEPFDVKVVAHSTEPTSAVLRILRNGAPVETKAIQLVKGKSAHSIRQSISNVGGYEFEALLESESDTSLENNRALAYTQVKGKPRVLYVEGVSGQSGYLTKALSDQEMSLDTVQPLEIPKTLKEYINYDMVIFSDVPAWSFTAEQMSIARSAVRDMGVGFTMVGGEDSFGAGGYFDTPIEELLPVYMAVKKTKTMPSSTVVIVMDKSGSMAMTEGGITKISLANDAAAAVVKLLHPVDYVSVIVCHSFPVTAVQLTEATNKESIYQQIATIRAEGGGIMVYPSMKAAYKTISSAPTRTKHIILLADGADCDAQQGTIELVKQMAKEKITVTAVSIGNGNDVPFLMAVAQAGKGGFYLTERAMDLKAIFTKDVMQISKSAIIEDPFVPNIDPTSPELAGMSKSNIPMLLGYVATTSKPAANVSMLTDKDDPLLATWRYGLGRTAAFTSDCKARWASHWLSWNNYSKFWAQVIRSTMRKSTSSEYQSSLNIENGIGYLTIDAIDSKGDFINSQKFISTLIRPDLSSTQIEIRQTAPGRYEAEFSAEENGSYIVSLVREGDDEGVAISTVASVPYSQEYKSLSSNETLLRQIAQIAKGNYNPEPEKIFGDKFIKAKDHTNLWRHLVILAAVLLPIDIAVRRIALSQQELMEGLAKLLSKLKISPKDQTKRIKSAAELTANNLLASKKERDSKQQKSETIVAQIPKVETKNDSKPEQFPEEENVTGRLLAAKRRTAKTDSKSVTKD